MNCINIECCNGFLYIKKFIFNRFFFCFIFLLDTCKLEEKEVWKIAKLKPILTSCVAKESRNFPPHPPSTKSSFISLNYQCRRPTNIVTSQPALLSELSNRNALALCILGFAHIDKKWNVLLASKIWNKMKLKTKNI